MQQSVKPRSSVQHRREKLCCIAGIYPAQTKHAQDFLCISLDATALDLVGNMLQVTDLYIYSPRTLSDDLAAFYPGIARLLANAKDPDAPLMPKAFQQNLSFTSAGARPCMSHMQRFALQQ